VHTEEEKKKFYDDVRDKRDHYVTGRYKVLLRITLLKKHKTLNFDTLTVFPHNLVLFKFLGFPSEKIILPPELEEYVLEPCNRILA